MSDLMVEYSDDGGRTWSAEQWKRLPVEGEYLNRIVLHAQGAAQNRLWRLTEASGKPVTILDAWADVEFSP